MVYVLIPQKGVCVFFFLGGGVWGLGPGVPPKLRGQLRKWLLLWGHFFMLGSSRAVCQVSGAFGCLAFYSGYKKGRSKRRNVFFSKCVAVAYNWGVSNFV